MLDDGLMCTVLGDEVFCQRIDPMLLQEIFQTPFSNNNNNIYTKKRKKKKRLVARQKHTLRKRVVVEYLNVWFR